MNFDNSRILFKPIEEKDTELIIKWRNNENVRHNFIFQETFTEEMHLNWMRTKVAKGEVVQFIIIIKETNKPIGSIYFRDIDYEKKEAEYGIFIGEDDEKGKGYGNETAKLALQYAFSELKLKTVFLRVFADNEYAIKSYKNAGFKETEYVKNAIENNGQYRDLIFMKIENEE